eukprot:TRINITY_DN48778_c0_g1_i1.p1 TRINITY_DN48778_c0_g1~~TRINITY_DN48778_c0_g1_i1.p1  ORF type:complete len:723 (-),score=246.13 TRINITY_DN48778_c0_g1_i1:63-2027(-)
MDAEQKAYEEYTKFCEDTIRDKGRAITEASERIEELSAAIDKNTAVVEKLSSELETHQSDISTYTKEKEEAVALRAQQQKDHDTTVADYEESIDAVGRALKVMEATAHNKAQASDGETEAALVQAVESHSGLSLLEISKASSPQDVKRAVTAFFSKEAPKAPKANGYDYQTGGVIDLLQDLQAKFLKEKGDIQLEEMKKKQAHELVLVGLNAELGHLSKQVEKKTGFKNTAEQALAADSAERDEKEATKAADSTYRKDLNTECKQKASDHAEKQKVRAEEMDTIDKAIGVIGGQAVVSASAKHSHAMSGGFIQDEQDSRPTALALLRAEQKKKLPDGLARALKLLQQRAGELSSSTLTRVAQQVSAVADPSSTVGIEAMTKVKTMIEDLLAKMNTQQLAEISHKSFCDKELGVNKLTRAEKTDEVDLLTAEIDQLEASLASLSEESASLSGDITKISEAMDTATKLRLKEKKQNAETIAESQAAKKAVTNGLTILQDFYSKAGTSLIQRESAAESEEAPDTYSGMQGQANGVIGMLEVILEDFSRLVADTKASDAAAEDEYKKFMEDSKVDKAEKETSSQHVQEKKDEQSTLLAQKQSDLASSKAELDAADEYYTELYAKCLSADSETEKERLKREEEIKAMKLALKDLVDLTR